VNAILYQLVDKLLNWLSWPILSNPANLIDLRNKSYPPGGNLIRLFRKRSK